MNDDIKDIITEGDTEDWVWDVVDFQTGGARDLTGATVKLYMWALPEQSIVIDGSACTHDDDGGQITYDVQDEDVDEPGEYQRQLLITLSSGEKKRYPDPLVQGRDYLTIVPAVEGTDTSS